MAMRRVWSLSLIALVLGLVVGCAGRRALRESETVPPPEAAVDTAITAAPESTAAAAESAPVEVFGGEEAEPASEIELPEEALPESAESTPLVTLGGPEGAAVAGTPWVPSPGPLPRGAEPVALTPGWRVQVASHSSRQTAETAAEKMRGQGHEPVRIHWVEGAYKVQVGDFLERREAEELRDRLRASGFEDAFIVGANVPDTTAAPAPAPAPAGVPFSDYAEGGEIQPESESVLVDGWRVQVMSLADRGAAERGAERVKKALDLPVYVEEVGGAFKVRVGDFPTKGEADAARKRVVEAGFPGAFPVKTRIRVLRETGGR